jgi:hypothetical protein
VCSLRQAQTSKGDLQMIENNVALIMLFLGGIGGIVYLAAQKSID